MSLKLDQKALQALPGPQREEAERAIKDLESARKANPLAFYKPHVKQRAFHSFTAHTKCFFGGTQSGKTTGGLGDDVIQAVDRKLLEETAPHLLPYKKFEPPFECRIMAESFPVLEAVLIPKLQDFLPLEQLVGGCWKDAYDKNLRVLYFQNGSKFFFMTYEQEVRKMGGWSGNRVHFDEEPPLSVYNECKWRVTAKSGDLVFTMTPVFGLTWTYDQLWQKRGDQVAKEVFKAPDIDVVTVSVEDNPALGAKEISLALEGLSDEEKAARREGKFVALHGLIYADFDKNHHVSPESPLPENVNIVVGIDPGYRHPAAVVWAYLTPDDTMVIFEAQRFHGLSAKQVCERITEVNDRYEINPIYYVIDPNARNKEHQTGRSTQMEYADNGIVTIAGQNSVAAGINRVRERFQTDRLFVRANCTEMVDELLKYRWKKPPKSGEDTREAPVKLDDHLCFIAGTLVTTARGDVPIERLRQDDLILTREGFFPIDWTRPTQYTPTQRLKFEGGEVIATADHPIFHDGEFVRLDSLRYGDRLTICQSPSSTQESNGAATPMPNSGPIRSTTAQPSAAIFTAASGKTTMARSQTGAIFTTTMGTRSITIPPTSNASRLKSIFTLISRQRGGKRLLSAWRRFVRSRRRGTHRPRVLNGIPGTAKKLGPSAIRSPRIVTNAVPNSIPFPDARVTASVPIVASRPGGAIQELTMRTGLAPSVAQASASTATEKPRLAHANVLSVSDAGKRQVYALKVDGPSEYFANGLLVSNCDAARYIVMSRPYLPHEERNKDESTMQRLMREDQESFQSPDQTNVGQFSGIPA